MTDTPITEALDNVAHHDLRYDARHGEAYGDNVNQVLIFPTEFADIQREYPILFRQEADGSFISVALLGLDRNENLFLGEDGWQGRYIPAMRARGPFVIGMRGADDADPQVHVDLSDPRIGRETGDPLFLTHGGNSARLDRVAQTLRTLHQGREISPHMFAAFQQTGILAPTKIDLALDESTGYSLPGFFTVNAEALHNLSAEALEALNRSGFLTLAFYALSSLGNMQRLIDLKAARHAKG